MICFTKIGMSAALTTSTKPTIENTQVMPASAFIPTVVSAVWNPTKIASISHLIGHRIISKTFIADQPFPWL